MQVEPMTNLPEGNVFGAAPSQHSAPTMPGEAPVTSPRRQLPGAGEPASQPPETDAAAGPADGAAQKNSAHRLLR